MTRIWPVPDEGLGNSSYVAEVAEGLALVVDPGGVARTDLAGRAQAEAWTRAAYRSARTLLDELPENLAAYPTHGPGSSCSAGETGEHTTTIGRERTASPLLFAAHGLGLAAIGLIKGAYPLLWGAGQLLTGRLSDTLGRKPLIVAGMLVQAAAFPAFILLARPLTVGIVSAVLLGTGTAMAYPALIAAVADHTQPSWRARGLAAYRFWRDLGYAIGAVIAGLVAQAMGLRAAVATGGALTFASGLLAASWITGKPGGAATVP